MLIEYDKISNRLISITGIRSDNADYTQDEIEIIASICFVELPESSYACFVMDKQKADEIWLAHTAGQEITLVLDELGCFEDAIILPEPESTIEESA